MNYNRLVAWLLRSPLHSLMGKAVMLVCYTGRKSGKLMEVPVNFVRVGSELLVTSRAERTWWRNFRGGGQAALVIQRRETPAQARVYEDPAGTAEKLGQYLAQVPGHARYFDVRLNEDGQPSLEDLQTAAAGRVVVVFTLK